MNNILKLKTNFLAGLLRPTITTTDRFESSETNTKTKTPSKMNSLAYLAYKNRKQKGLITNETECPTIFFGDEWAL